MPSLNKCLLIGNLTRDPELKFTPKGTAVADFGIAINRNYTTADGEKREEVTFLNLAAFGKQAETIAQYMKKGKPIFVECHAKVDSWDDKQTGQKRTAVKFVIDSFQFLGGKKDDGDGSGEDGGDHSYGPGANERTQQQRPQGGGYSAPARQAPRPPSDPGLDAGDMDIPF